MAEMALKFHGIDEAIFCIFAVSLCADVKQKTAYQCVAEIR